MAPQLTSNVEVNGTWYGPDYRQNGDPPEGTVTNEAAYADAAADTADPGLGGPVDLRFRRDDFATPEGEDAPNLREGEQATPTVVGEVPPRTGKGSGADAWAEFAAANGVAVDPDASKDEIIGVLEARGVVQADQ